MAIKAGMHRRSISGCESGKPLKYHDDACCGVLWVEAPDGPAAIISLDFIGLYGPAITSVKPALAKRLGLALDRLFITCSHTHSVTDLDAAKLTERLEQAACAARDSAQPAAVAFARVPTGGKFCVNRRVRVPGVGALTITFYRNNHADLENGRMEASGQVRDFLRYGAKLYHPGYHREGRAFARHPASPSAEAARALAALPEKIHLDGPVDSDLEALVFRSTAGDPIGSLIRFACHPVIYGDAETTGCSADYPGVLCREIEKATRAPAMFVNGPCADVKPLILRNGPDEMERFGSALAAQLLPALRSAAAQPLEDFRWASHEEDFAFAPEMIGTTAEVLDKANADFSAMAADAFHPAALRKQLDHLLRAWVGADVLKTNRKTMPIRIYGMRFNDVLVAALPAEIFTQTSLEIKQALHGRSVMTIELTDSADPHYIPALEEFQHGGYEVAAACLTSDAAGRIRDTAVKLLRQIQ
jgi:hypothetical protein